MENRKLRKEGQKKYNQDKLKPSTLKRYKTKKIIKLFYIYSFVAYSTVRETHYL